MVRARVIETMDGIQDAFDVQAYDRMMRRLWKRGWVETKEVLHAGIVAGEALEISPGPGYLGIDWLQKTEGSHLTGLDLSEEMLWISRKNASKLGVGDHARYVYGDACAMPFEGESFDAVFANGGMHEWADPVAVFNEIARVLRPGGRYCITDMRRDANFLVRCIMPWTVRERVMRRGFLTSMNAAYIPGEAHRLVERSSLQGASVSGNWFGLVVVGQLPVA
ncbi:class I SAM-dependent methyltransferase [Candidatus Bipolaricaulota bacterium]|nr:class I SAM-dependent methyltransferase [Candidatus Bipolaricaulota bacterium]